MLKVLHINTYDGNGGAGRACLRLSQSLENTGIHSEILVLYQSGDKTLTTLYRKGLIGKLQAVFNIVAERILSKIFTKNIQTPFSVQWFGKQIVQHPLVKSADIIHLHWINHGFVKPKFIAQLEALEKPIVWTFHDSNAFTGGCHVRYDCEHFHRHCGNCPQLKMSGNKDLSYRTWKRKEKAYSKLNFHIIAPSHWMRKSIKESSLLGMRSVSVIPNTVETTVFKPYVKSEAKQILKIKAGKFVIMSGFMPSKNDKHKGTSYLVEALALLAGRSSVCKEDIELVIFGNKDERTMPVFPFKTTFLGTINKDEHLAKCYAAADVFVAPSLEDNLPNTVMEALACATPVVAFTTGGIPDMVKHLQNGYLAQYQSAEDLADGIEWIYAHASNTDLQKEARKIVLEQFAPQVIARRHIQLYTDLLKTMPK